MKNFFPCHCFSGSQAFWPAVFMALVFGSPAPGDLAVQAKAAGGAAGAAGAAAPRGSEELSPPVLAQLTAPLAVWRLQRGNGRSGTGFFVSPSLMLTNAHVLFGLSDDPESFDEKSIRLQRPGAAVLGLSGPPEREIKSVRAVSFSLDLALLEMEFESPFYLTFRESDLSEEEDLRVTGYPGAAFELASMRKINKLQRYDGAALSFLVDHSDIPGASGSPVIDSHGRAAGIVLSSGGRNSVVALPARSARAFLEGKSGEICSGSLKKCLREARAQNLKEAEEGGRLAQYYLAHRLRAKGSPQSLAEAALWHERSAENGFFMSQANLADMYNDGDGVEQNFEKAVFWWRRSADQGDSMSQFNLCVKYYEGLAVEQSFQKAFSWCRRAASQGDALAQYNLASMYYYGHGVQKSFKEAARWFQRAADMGSADSQSALAWIYYQGGWGLEQDFEKAAFWWRRSAELGLAVSQFYLGRIYQRGEGLEQDMEAASVWLERAAMQGHAAAAAALNKDFGMDIKIREEGDSTVIEKTIYRERGENSSMAESAIRIERGDIIVIERTIYTQ